MTVEMLSVLAVFLLKRGVQGRLFSCSAALFGLLTSVICLLLLLIAEVKRTCPDNNNAMTRLLAAPQDYSKAAVMDAECNPKFGERNEGLGTIEPFTCLISLSPLRFFAAMYVVRCFGSGGGQDLEKNPKNREESHHTDPTCKVRDLWMTSIGLHSNVAKSFGLFSAELLQCMLGIYVKHPEASDANAEGTVSKHQEREKNMDVTCDTSSRGETSLNPSAVQQLPIPVDCLDAPVRDDRYDDRFAYPNARLIRRMRRCEMRLLPLVNKWAIVDVVVTKHELVLFDVDSTPDADALRIFTKSGGKQLRLCSIAKGRKVMDKVSNENDASAINFSTKEHLCCDTQLNTIPLL